MNSLMINMGTLAEGAVRGVRRRRRTRGRRPGARQSKKTRGRGKGAIGNHRGLIESLTNEDEVIIRFQFVDCWRVVGSLAPCANPVCACN